jgi:hypothetical protein
VSLVRTNKAIGDSRPGRETYMGNSQAAVFSRRPRAGQSRDVIERLPHVEAPLHYLEPMSEKPRSLEYEPAPGVPRTTAVYRDHMVTIRDVRPVASALSLEREGFQLVTAATNVRDFYDEEAVRTRYHAETVALLEKLTGASRVVVFDHTIRRRIPGSTDRTTGIPRQPVPRVHNDYTVKSGPQRVRDLLGEDASDLLRRRFSVITSGGLSAGRYKMHRWLSPMLKALTATISSRRISSTPIVPVRSTT